MSACVLDAVQVHRLRIPLTRPYRLAFGPVTHYDTLLVEIVGSDGVQGFGEATLLTGYTDETIDGSWSLAQDLARDLAGVPIAQARKAIERISVDAAFTATAFATSLDMIEGHPMLSLAEPTRVPILGLLQGNDRAELVDDFARLASEGYRTVKVKIGFVVGHDLAYVAQVQDVVAGRAAIRVDANQGYTPAQASTFVAGLDPEGIELFEQPCRAGAWDHHRIVVTAAARTGLPLMLDESIYGLPDIERAAAEHACAFLKVKLMKFVSLDRLVAAIERIHALGFRAVIGNGVATDVSCWMEACVAARLIDNAGEMNGFLKAKQRLFERPLQFRDGCIVLDRDAPPAIDRSALEAFRVGHASYRRTAACGGTPSSPA